MKPEDEVDVLICGLCRRMEYCDWLRLKESVGMGALSQDRVALVRKVPKESEGGDDP